ncbi:hypothetical protein LCGC14_0464410 [marine sediment metagenome]|uniref:Uncharacterized protein n=1 Tax=marine sediment metagenome TaxID=412755 RepID=A0A0F9SJ52_9ZZZZ
MAGWRETAILYLIFSIILSGTVSMMNAMSPTQIFGIPDSGLSQWQISEANIENLEEESRNPDALLASNNPVQILGFLAPVISGVSFLLQVVFTVFLSWSLLIDVPAQALGIPSQFTSILLVPILALQILAFLVLAREVKETIPFAG